MSEIKVMNDDEIRDFCIKKDLKIFELEQEIERLNNIINELEKWLNEKKIVWNITREDRDIDYTIVEVLDKLQELKGEIK